LAREIGVSADLLEQFLAGRVTLLPTVLNDLARELFSGHAVYDETVDRLRPALRQEPRSLGIRPDRDYVTAPVSCGPPQPVDPPKPEPPLTKPGWAS
jgi:hypothetical protein